MEENNIKFGKWVSTHREALANLYFSFYESTMGEQLRNNEEGDIMPLDHFVLQVYENNQTTGGLLERLTDVLDRIAIRDDLTAE